MKRNSLNIKHTINRADEINVAFSCEQKQVITNPDGNKIDLKKILKGHKFA